MFQGLDFTASGLRVEGFRLGVSGFRVQGLDRGPNRSCVRGKIIEELVEVQMLQGLGCGLIPAARVRANRGENFGEVSRKEKMALLGTDPESYITEYT